MTPKPSFETPPPARDYPHSILDFRGHYDVTLALLPFPSQALASILPPALRLEAVPASPPGMHPLLVAFGYQSGVHQILTSFLPDLNYWESVIAIPSVRLAAAPSGYDGPFNWMSRLDVSGLLALILGRLVGYPKHLSRMHGDEKYYRISPLLGGRPMLEVSLRRYGSPGPAANFPLFHSMHELLRCPLISRPAFGPYLYTLFQWEIAKATMQPSEITIEVATADMPGLPRGQYHIEGIDQSALGAVHMQVPWEVVKPFPRKDIK